MIIEADLRNEPDIGNTASIIRPEQLPHATSSVFRLNRNYKSQMSRIFHITLLICLLSFQLTAKSTFISSDSIPDAPVIHRAQLDSLLSLNDDTTRVYNFWATWCRPCVAELPVFFELENTVVNQPVKFIYISLYFKRERTGALRKFINTRHLHNTILLLDEPDYNTWIDAVDPSWQGSIPATLVISGSKNIRRFHEGELDAAGLKKLIGM